jgi:hypothetical protein
MLTKSRPAIAKQLFEEAQRDVEERWRLYEHLSSRSPAAGGDSAQVSGTAAPPPSNA